MKSLICPIEGNANDIKRAIDESITFSKNEGLNENQTNVISLLTDEMLGMVEGIFVSKDGKFWIEHVDNDFILNLSVEAEIGDRAKAIFDSTSANKEYKGISGLIKKTYDTVAQMFEVSGTGASIDFGSAPISGIEQIDDGAYEWVLSKYEASCERDEKAEQYDELEIPVIKKFSKDIAISYRNKKVDIKVIANV